MFILTYFVCFAIIHLFNMLYVISRSHIIQCYILNIYIIINYVKIVKLVSIIVILHWKVKDWLILLHRNYLAITIIIIFAVTSNET